jgi:hypothetical protein
MLLFSRGVAFAPPRSAFTLTYQPTPRLFCQSAWKGAFCFRSPQGKLILFVQAKKSLRLRVYSLGTGTQEGMHINPNKK